MSLPIVAEPTVCMFRPTLPERFSIWPECGARLEYRPHGDEWAWLDEQGSAYAILPLPVRLSDAETVDIATAYGYARLTDIAGVGDPRAETLLHIRTMLQFVALTHRHRPLAEVWIERPIEVPEHCAWPMRLAPDRWQCRQCMASEPLAWSLDFAGDFTLKSAGT